MPWSLQRIRFSSKNRKELIALANAGGGVFQLGFSEEGKVVGFRKTDRLSKEIFSVAGEIQGLEILQLKEKWWENQKRFTIDIVVGPSREWLHFNHQGAFWLPSGIQRIFRDEWEEWTGEEGKVFFCGENQSLVEYEEAWNLFQKKRQPFRRDARGEKIPEIDLDQSERTIEVIRTGDGSTSLYFKELDETYHSHQGAWEESNWVFIHQGLEYKSFLEKIKVLEIGFGTGLNAGLSFGFTKQFDKNVEYVTLEPYPLQLDDLKALNYAGKWSAEIQNVWELCHTQAMGAVGLFGKFSFEKRKEKIQEFCTEQKFDVLFFDAFAPNKQAELWSVEIFQKCHSLLASGGVLVTYCANGQFKRNLKSAGFEVELLPGPPGRREMVRGVKK